MSRAPLDWPGYSRHLSVLEQLFDGKASTQETADGLASVALSQGTSEDDLAAGIGLIWATIIISAKEKPDHIEQLGDVLVKIAQLPDAVDEHGSPLILYGMQIWHRMPTFSWELNDEYNGFHIPTDEQRQLLPPARRNVSSSELVTQLANLNTLVAMLTKTRLQAFDFSLFALWTMRAALEIPVDKTRSDQPLDAWIPAAAAWIRITGDQVFRWGHEYPSGPLEGAPGKGGPMWQGKHGLCHERWQLWHSRFQYLGTKDQVVDAETRKTAKEAADRMAAIECQSADDTKQ
ncbi:hypothetical protein KC343_g6071 [Hortaea werneckii]|nr:hypothetical protein KC338_g5400 [Hortaea werneckii]KAI7234105.1 hypothetical protein KC352_g15114 [Hortaea werneckii]KAI7565539.1 hypothetical protein KC317_g6297 [Hortaea werneckii]KAI7608146.1 hypothetical protein KC346_g9732 [Hortaea werneckii]KAI7627216.1 hypothetical protein KC343_g6071 [Hortaea werneckii]